MILTILTKNVMKDVDHVMELDQQLHIIVKNVMYLKMEHINIISQLIKNINV